MKYLNKRQIQKQELKILIDFKKFAEEKKLRYYLFAGTALGAVRHKGFIPWDDDIDISMPRPDYERLIKIVRANKNCMGDNYIIDIPDLMDKPKFLFAKVYNKKIKMIADNGIDSNYLWMDIFPLDGLPEKGKEKYALSVKRSRERFARKRYLTYRPNDIIANSRSKVHIILANLRRMPYRLVNYNWLVSRFLKKCSKYEYDKAKYVCSNTWIMCLGDITPKKWIGNGERYAIFEGESFPVYEKVEKYLKRRYGDYMKLPPVDKRITHSFKAWIDGEK